MESPFSHEDEIYEVEKIIRKRWHPSKGVQYYVKWRHFPNSENTWEPACNFSQKLIDDYESSVRKKPKSSKLCQNQEENVISAEHKASSSTTASGTDVITADSALPSSSSSCSSSSSSATIISSQDDDATSLEAHAQTKRLRGRPKKRSPARKASSKKQSSKQKLSIFNPVSKSLVKSDEPIYEPELVKKPIVITDVTFDDQTVTVIEYQSSEGFFSK